MSRTKILAISGSTRQNSSNEAILKTITTRFENTLDIEIFNKIDELPHFNPDLDNENLPAIVKNFRAKIEGAEGVIFCTPEYVFSLPGSLKNAMEWNVSTTIFSNKPVAIIVAAAAGEKALESLDLILTTIEATIPEDAKLLIKGGRGKIGDDGLINENALLEKIDKVVGALVESIKGMKND